MALPKPEVPIYELTIPSSGQRVQYRPFLVREEKILLLALRGEDESQILNAIESIVEGCLLSPVDVKKLAMYDIEFIFLKIRSKSIGEEISLQYLCKNVIETTKKDPDSGKPITVKQPCNTSVPIKISLETLEVTKEPGHTNKIDLDNGIGIVMKYPNMEMVKTMLVEKRDIEDIANTLDVIAMCIESVFTKDTQTSEFTIPEAVEFLEGLTQKQFQKIQAFYDTIPKLRKDVKFVCPKCSYEQDIVLEGIQSFFG